MSSPAAWYLHFQGIGILQGKMSYSIRSHTSCRVHFPWQPRSVTTPLRLITAALP